MDDWSSGKVRALRRHAPVSPNHDRQAGSGVFVKAAVQIYWGGSADCDLNADSCSASASTQVSFDTGQSDADSVSVDETVNGDTYNGTLSATSSAITSIEATNDSSASIDRNEPSGPDVQQIELTGVASDPDGDSLSYEWYEGTDTSGSPEGTGETHDLGAKSCSYSQDWTLLVTDGDANDTQRQTIEALPAPICGGGLSPTPGG